MDIEGNEINALKGMEKLINKNADLKLIIEFNPSYLNYNGKSPSDFWQILNKLGFLRYYAIFEYELKFLNSIDEIIKLSLHRPVNLLCGK